MMPKSKKLTAGDTVQRDGRPSPETAWFTNDRLGMFIHWGLYTLAARHEWIKNFEKISDADYQKYFDHFNPDLFDPKMWAHLAKQAGMKYVVITTKHHEGFCMWDSKLTDFKSTNSPAQKDLLKPLVEAFRKEGLKVGFYYSLIDWHHPEFTIDGNHPLKDDEAALKRKRDMNKYVDYFHAQVRELLTEFGRIDVIWFDFSYSFLTYKGLKGKGKDDWQAEKLVKMVRELMPGILINNRLEIPQDFYTPEQFQPKGCMQVDGKSVVWEACQTFSGSWGYHRDEYSWKSTDLLIRMLIDTVANDGNMLLNVGPNGRGELDIKAVQRLCGLGEWMRLNNRSIYGCRSSKFVPPPDCRYTQNGNRLYLHLFSWPFKHVHLEGLAGKVVYAQLLHDASEIKMRHWQKNAETNPYLEEKIAEGTLTLELPALKPNVEVPVVELFLK